MIGLLWLLLQLSSPAVNAETKNCTVEVALLKEEIRELEAKMLLLESKAAAREIKRTLEERRVKRTM